MCCRCSIRPRSGQLRSHPSPSGLCRERRLGGEGSTAERELLQLLLQGRVGLLRGGKVAGRKTLADLVEILEQGILAAGIPACAAVMTVMVEVGVRDIALLLDILLDTGKVLLRGGKVAGLEIGGELVHGLGDGIGSGSRGTGGSSGGGQVGLRSQEIARLEILAELLHVLLIRRSDGAKLVLKEAAA